MATIENVILKVSADTTEVTRGIEQVGTSVDQTKSSVGGLTSGLDRMTGGAVSGFRSMVTGIRGGVLGLQTLKGAIAATGIGLLVIAIAGLVSYFKDTERGAQSLRVITATLGAVMDKLKDVVIGLGEKIFDAFSNPKEAVIELWKIIKTNLVNRLMGLLEWIPSLGKALMQVFEGDFTGAAKTAADAAGKIALGVENITDKMEGAAEQTAAFAAALKKAGEEADALAKRENDLKVGEREFLIVRANTNKLIAEKRLLVEDETLSYEKRVEALDIAIAAEKETIAVELEFAKERAAILAEKADMAESDEATKLAVAEAEAQVVELQTRSLKAQKRLEGERQSIMLQRDALQKTLNADVAKENEALRKADEEALLEEEEMMNLSSEMSMSAFRQDQEIEQGRRDEQQKTFDHLTTLLEDKTEANRVANEAIEANNAALAETERVDNEAKKERVQAYLDTAKASLDALASLNDAFTGDSDREQKKGFERSKKIQIAQALIGTYESANSAFGSLAGIPIVGPALGAVAAAGAVVAGLANVKKIKSTTFSGGGGDQSNSYSGVGGAGSGPPTPTSPQLDLSFLGGGAGQDGFRTYVIASEVSNSQQANQRINDQAALVG